MIFLKLFWSFFQIGLFSIGGGYAALPLIQNQVVNVNGWLNVGEFIDLITISQLTPGPIALNSATFVGIRVAGTLGAIVATAGCVFAPFILVSLLAFLYFKYKDLSLIQGILKGLRPAVIALVGSAGLSILILSLWGKNGFSFNFKSIDVISAALFSLSLFILRRFKLNPIFVMMGAGVIGGFLYLLV